VTSLTNESISKFVKERLDAHLIGHIGFHTRKKMVEKFFAPAYKYRPKDYSGLNEKPDTVTFLDCVLNDQFTEICIHNSEIEKINAILVVIFKNAPNLSSLNVNYYNLFLPSLSPLPKIPGGPIYRAGFIQALENFTHLTSLKLDFLPSRRPFFLGQVVSACPQLIHLSLGSFFFENRHALALILGKGVGVFSREEELFIQELEFTPSFTSSLCKTLKSLELIHHHDNHENKIYPIDFQYYNNPQHTLAFALRHLKHLEEVKQDFFSYPFFAAYAVQVLHQSQIHKKSKGRKKVVVKRRSNSNYLWPLKWTIGSPFSGW
jgi:hypothetical protein